MNKKSFKVLIIIILILLLAVLFIYLLNKKTANNQNLNQTHQIEVMSESEKNSLGPYHLGVYEVISRDASGKVKSYRLIKLNDEKPVELSFMTNAEKEKMFASSSSAMLAKVKIQVLQRDAAGNVVAYKILKNDSDIVKKY